ncbi:MAG: hypothetical protein AAF281_05730 [Pseudomonadota bacterium]
MRRRGLMAMALTLLPGMAFGACMGKPLGEGATDWSKIKFVAPVAKDEVVRFNATSAEHYAGMLAAADMLGNGMAVDAVKSGYLPSDIYATADEVARMSDVSVIVGSFGSALSTTLGKEHPNKIFVDIGYGSPVEQVRPRNVLGIDYTNAHAYWLDFKQNDVSWDCLNTPLATQAFLATATIEKAARLVGDVEENGLSNAVDDALKGLEFGKNLSLVGGDLKYVRFEDDAIRE